MHRPLRTDTGAVSHARNRPVFHALNSALSHYQLAQEAINFVAFHRPEKTIPELTGYIDYATCRAHGGYALAKREVNAEHVLQAMENAGLGGAAFARAGSPHWHKMSSGCAECGRAKRRARALSRPRVVRHDA